MEQKQLPERFECTRYDVISREETASQVNDIEKKTRKANKREVTSYKKKTWYVKKMDTCIIHDIHCFYPVLHLKYTFMHSGTMCIYSHVYNVT